MATAPAAAPAPAPPLSRVRAAGMAGLTVVFGALTAVQVASMSVCSARAGVSVAGAAVNFAGGLLLLSLATLAEVTSSGGKIACLRWRERPALRHLAPGALGCVYVFGSLSVTAAVGASSFWVAAIAGQLASAQALDHFGLGFDS